MPTTTAHIDRDASLPDRKDDWACGGSALEVMKLKSNMRLFLADQAVRTATWREVLEPTRVIFPPLDRDPLDDQTLATTMIVRVSASEREAAARATSWVGNEVTLTAADDE